MDKFLLSQGMILKILKNYAFCQCAFEVNLWSFSYGYLIIDIIPAVLKSISAEVIIASEILKILH